MHCCKARAIHSMLSLVIMIQHNKKISSGQVEHISLIGIMQNGKQFVYKMH